MAKNKHVKEGEELRKKGEPRPKEPWFPTNQQKRNTVDRKIGWDEEDARRKKKAKR